MESNERFLALERYGVSMKEVMERFMDDEELYVDCLRMFMNDASFDTLQKSLAEGDYTQAFEAAHTLKGVAGNLGLGPLYAAICELVERLRAKRYDDLAPYYAAVTDQLAKLREIMGEQR